jgi:Ca2+-binding EF-hand superfamily protein
MIDQDKDGFISKNDIRQTFDSLGENSWLGSCEMLTDWT